jgi:hypothetical protein
VLLDVSSGEELMIHCLLGTAATEADGPTDVQHVEVVSGKHVAVR